MSLAHHTLVAWRRADDLFIKLHRLSLKAFPAYERFESGGQLRRAAFSVPCHIELELEIKKVGAPLAGLIRSERVAQGIEVVGAVLFFVLVATQII